MDGRRGTRPTYVAPGAAEHDRSADPAGSVTGAVGGGLQASANGKRARSTWHRQQQRSEPARWSRSSARSSTSNSRRSAGDLQRRPHRLGRRGRRREDRRRRGGRAAPRREPRARGRDEADRRHDARHEGDRHRRAHLGAGRPETLGRVLNVLGEPVDFPIGPCSRRSAGRFTATRRRSKISRPS